MPADDRFAQRISRLTNGKTVLTRGPLTRRQSAAGNATITTTLVLQLRSAGAPVFIFAEQFGERAEWVMATASSDDALQRYGGQIDAFTTSIAAADAPARSREAVRTSVAPPPPGRVRLDGLYASSRNESYMGYGSTVQFRTTWQYYYFMPNGYLYQGEMGAGMEAMQCSAPTLDARGSVLCTTYSADDGQLRIGTGAPAPLQMRGTSLRYGSNIRTLTPKQRSATMNGRLTHFDAGVAAVSENGMTFTDAGRFRASSDIAVGYTTDPSGSQPTRVTVTGSGGSKTSGTYRINGYTVVLTYDDGDVRRLFFAPINQQFVQIGSAVYLRP